MAGIKQFDVSFFSFHIPSLAEKLQYACNTWVRIVFVLQTCVWYFSFSKKFLFEFELANIEILIHFAVLKLV